jgi:hypothetical protein
MVSNEALNGKGATLSEEEKHSKIKQPQSGKREGIRRMKK